MVVENPFLTSYKNGWQHVFLNTRSTADGHPLPPYYARSMFDYANVFANVGLTLTQVRQPQIQPELAAHRPHYQPLVDAQIPRFLFLGFQKKSKQ
jgi:hypothetical protein